MKERTTIDLKITLVFKLDEDIKILLSRILEVIQKAQEE